MSSTSAPRALHEPAWLERWRIRRAGSRDRVRFRTLPFTQHTPWTREQHARYAALAIAGRRELLDRWSTLEKERARLHIVVRQERAAGSLERPVVPSTALDRHVWALQARRDAMEAERVRSAHARLAAIDVELRSTGELIGHVIHVHEQAYLQRVHLYNARRASAKPSDAASLAVPAFALPVVEDEHPHLFHYAIAA